VAPNRDPLSVARIRAIPASDNQITIAGEPAERPLTVLATDEFGRPVAGAELVFRVLHGTGGFDDDFTPEAVVVTDALGLASIRYHAGQLIADPKLIKLDVQDVHPTRVDVDRIEAVAPLPTGLVRQEIPFRMLVRPGPPAAIERLWEVPSQVDYQRAFFNSPVQDTLVYRVVDRFSNPVANSPVQLSAHDEPSCLTPGSRPEGFPWLPTQFAPAGQCVQALLESLDPSCGSSTLELITNADGQALADLALANYTFGYSEIVASAGTLEDRAVVESPHGIEMPARDCDRLLSTPDLLFSVHVARLSIEARTTGGWPMEAARPLQRLSEPRFLMAGCFAFRDTIAWDTPVIGPLCGTLQHEGLVGVNLASKIRVSRGGRATSLRRTGPKTYKFELIAGPTPGWHSVELVAGLNPDDLLGQMLSGPIGSYFTVDGAVGVTSPLPIVLSDQGVLTQSVDAELGILPDSYRPDRAITQIREVGQPADSSPPADVKRVIEGRLPSAFTEEPPPRERTIEPRFASGIVLDPEKDYELAAVLNPGTPWEIPLTPAPLTTGQRIVSGFDVQRDEPNRILPEVLTTRPRHLTLFQDIDIANQLTCAQGGIFRFQVNHRARVSLTFNFLNADGSPSSIAWQAIDGQVFDEGLHHIEIDMNRLRFGDFVYQLTADSLVFDGLQEQHAGTLSHKANRRDQLALAHAMVEDVDVFDGSLNLSRADFQLPGRGPGLKFVRGYSSQRALVASDLGYGWTHNYAAALQITPCGEHIISGADGQSMRFVPDGMDGGVERFRPLLGYTGELRGLEDGSFEFFSKNGTLFVFEPDLFGEFRLMSIEDPNGNAIVLEYEDFEGRELLAVARDGAGRQLRFNYQIMEFDSESRGASSQPAIVGVEGPLGASVEFEYDQ